MADMLRAHLSKRRDVEIIQRLAIGAPFVPWNVPGVQRGKDRIAP